ncbi:DUF4157 domain-containing protein [Streptomyces sp. AC555_RSS877]|uniref:eCIS core domain-containing protein n=1 Tax=Streptomyces sp. AC555_RSS877 TaxID=2823688 RepID=UPI0027E3E0AF|nr:DUF4157 domain-containing protein [Streptomyces sp. AC555_RSS877]
MALQRLVGNAVVARAVEEQRHSHGAGCGHGSEVQRSAVHDVLGSAGRPLDTPLRTEMEARLGADFGDVRLHTDEAARDSAAEVGARAYTSGHHVVVGHEGMDKHTLAHELTHVVQQRQGPVAGTDNGSGLTVSDPSDRFEREAEANATRVMSRQYVDEGAVQRSTHATRGAEDPVSTPSATAGTASVQRAGGRQAAAGARTPGSGESSGSEDGKAMAQAELKFKSDARVLWDRIGRIKPLAAKPRFRKGVVDWLATVRNDMEMAVDGEAGRNEVNKSAVADIMAGFHADDVRGHQVNYMWFLQHQDTEGMFEGGLTGRATASSEHGQIWSKMGAAEAINDANVGRGVALESSVQGYIFNGLGFGLPRWNDSPTMGELWHQLSRTFAKDLTNWVTAHVLDGIDSSSVLTTTEWPEIKKKIESGEVNGLNVLVYAASPGEKRHELRPVDMFTVQTQEEFDSLPKVPGNDEWRKKQWKIDSEQKDALEEVYARQRDINGLDAYLKNVFREHGGEDKVRFRAMRTPNNTAVGTFSHRTFTFYKPS